MACATVDEVKQVAEELVVHVVERVLENRRPELLALERDVSKLESVKSPFPRISYDESVKRLQAKGSEIQWAGDFGGTDATLIPEEHDRPVMVEPFPSPLPASFFAPTPTP